MAKYDFSAQQVTTETTAEYVFSYIPGAPSIILRPAHDSNPLFHDERIRMSLEKPADLVNPRRNAPVTVDDVKASEEKDREADRVLLARACAADWGTPPVDVNGKPAPAMCEAEAYDFFKALPDHMFDPMRNFAMNLFNFLKRPPIETGEAALVGNG